MYDDVLRLLFHLMAGMVGLAVVWWVVEKICILTGIGGESPAPQHIASVTPAHPTTPARQASTSVEPPDYAEAAARLAAGAEWLNAVNDQPTVNPHLALCGPSGSGKSTFALAALSQREGALVITTPKPHSQDPWASFPVVRLRYSDAGASWAGIEGAIAAVSAEMWRRNSQDEAGPPLTLVIDEFTTTLAKLPHLHDAILDMWVMGRSAGIRLVTIAPEVSVRAWKIEGRGDVRENILFVEYAEDKSARMYRWGKAPRRINVRDVPALAAAGLDPARVWVPDAPVAGRSSVPAAITTPALFNAPTSVHVTEHERALILRWQAEGERSMRALARRLYVERGGDDPKYAGDGDPFYAVKAVVQGVSVLAGVGA